MRDILARIDADVVVPQESHPAHLSGSPSDVQVLAASLGFFPAQGFRSRTMIGLAASALPEDDGGDEQDENGEGFAQDILGQFGGHLAAHQYPGCGDD